MLTYETAKAQIVAALGRAVTSHERGDYAAVGEGYDALAPFVPRDQPPRFNKILVALSYWDAWIRAGKNGWPENEDIRKDEWPQLAREVIALLNEDKEILIGRIARLGLTPWRETEEWFRDYLRDHPELLDPLPPQR
jgi:hypothetical protein